MGPHWFQRRLGLRHVIPVDLNLFDYPVHFLFSQAPLFCTEGRQGDTPCSRV